MPVTALYVICYRREVEILTPLMQITVRQSLTSFVECEVGFKHFFGKKYNSPRYPHRKYVFHSNRSSHTEEQRLKSPSLFLCLLFLSAHTTFFGLLFALISSKKRAEPQQLSIIIRIFANDSDSPQGLESHFRWYRTFTKRYLRHPNLANSRPEDTQPDVHIGCIVPCPHLLLIEQRTCSTICHDVGYLELLILVKALREPGCGISEEVEHPRLSIATC